MISLKPLTAYLTRAWAHGFHIRKWRFPDEKSLKPKHFSGKYHALDLSVFEY